MHNYSLNIGVKKKTSANLAGLLALPCRIAEFSCVPPHKEEEKPLGPHTNYQQLVQNFCQLFLANGHILTYLYTSMCRVMFI